MKEDVKNAAKVALESGSPDVSGGLEINEDNDVVYFKDKNGNTSLIMSGDNFRAFVKAKNNG